MEKLSYPTNLNFRLSYFSIESDANIGAEYTANKK